jgi:hypothetical protein
MVTCQYHRGRLFLVLPVSLSAGYDAVSQYLKRHRVMLSESEASAFLRSSKKPDSSPAAQNGILLQAVPKIQKRGR